MCVTNYDRNKSKFLKFWNLMFEQYMFENRDGLKAYLQLACEKQENPISF